MGVHASFVEADVRTAMRYAVIETTPLVIVALNARSERVAGPRTTLPLVLNREPWHGHWNTPLSKPVMVHASCVQVAVRTEKLVSPVRTTSNWPRFGLETRAAPLVDASDVPATVTVAAPLTTVAFNVDRSGTEPPPGSFGLPLLPPQAWIVAASAPSESA